MSVRVIEYRLMSKSGNFINLKWNLQHNKLWKKRYSLLNLWVCQHACIYSFAFVCIFLCLCLHACIYGPCLCFCMCVCVCAYADLFPFSKLYVKLNNQLNSDCVPVFFRTAVSCDCRGSGVRGEGGCSKAFCRLTVDQAECSECVGGGWLPEKLCRPVARGYKYLHGSQCVFPPEGTVYTEASEWVNMSV